MTAQIGDIYKYKGEEYNIVAKSKPICFDPREYGLEPHMRNTACCRGYWCEYSIQEDGICLNNLFVFNKDGIYPDINGISVSQEEFELCKVFDFTSGKWEQTERAKYFGHREYKDLNIIIPFSGRILVGKDFIRGYHVNMGYQRAVGYKRLMEFLFDESGLVDVVDQSEMAKELRKMERSKSDKTELTVDEIRRFVEDSFSLDYETKAWWL